MRANPLNAVSVRIDCIEKLIAVGERLGGWVFRGHGSKKWRLETTLERAAARWGVKRTALREREKTLINSFQRRAHHYINDPPETKHLTEWAALLQHYGGPTRFLDVTRSYLVAAFFAVEKAEDDGIVWAFNQGPLAAKDEPEGPANPESPTLRESDAVLAGEQEDQGIRLVEPFRLNTRLVTQRGAFLMPLSLEMAFQDQLEQIMGCGLHSFTEIDLGEMVSHIMTPVWQIIIPNERHSEIIRFLARSNITAATLFEGLEGFARSLHTVMRIFD
jgi:hypothetical protein